MAKSRVEMVDEAQRTALKQASLPSITLEPDGVDRLELLMRGLAQPELGLSVDAPTALRDREGLLMGVLHPDGRIEGVALPQRYDFASLRSLPARGCQAVVARRPLFPEEIDALAVHPNPLIVADASGEGYFWLVRCLQLAAGGRVPIFVTPLAGMAQAVLQSIGAEAIELDVDVTSAEHGPEVRAELRRHDPPPSERGFALLFSGLSGSGKSTVANAVRAKLLEAGPRPVTLLDGDVVRTNLSKGLGFSKADRDANVRRIGFVAAEIAKNGGAAICAPIAPYEASRAAVRRMVEAVGTFILVHVSTPLEVCEARDRKGLYAKARRGEITEFTGISDPYETPTDAELVIDTSELEVGAAADRVIAYLRSQGLVA